MLLDRMSMSLGTGLGLNLGARERVRRGKIWCICYKTFFLRHQPYCILSLHRPCLISESTLMYLTTKRRGDFGTFSQIFDQGGKAFQWDNNSKACVLASKKKSYITLTPVSVPNPTSGASASGQGPESSFHHGAKNVRHGLIISSCWLKSFYFSACIQTVPNSVLLRY
jgi:hypothetical protein